MRYKISVPGYMDIATCETFKDVRKALKDGGCMHRMTMDEFTDMVDSLLTQGYWGHSFADDPRFNFIVVVVK